MISKAQQKQHTQWLKEITSIPTAAGRERRVIRWVKQWVAVRAGLRMTMDVAGNVIVTQQSSHARAKPLYITAHMDHPAFVVREIIDDRAIELEFRGGVLDPYFHNARVEILDQRDRAIRGRVTTFDIAAKPFKRVIVKLEKSARTIVPGDLGRWCFGDHRKLPRIEDGLLHTHACDDLAAVAAALSVLDVIRKHKDYRHVSVLLTRAEELGFIGAIAACKHESVARDSRLICLENSRSFADSPIGAGAIVRVGDKLSVFEPTLTNRISAIIMQYAAATPSFKWQRKLMAGGTCEATTFSTYGFQSTCLCLPLGNYHNMRDIDGVLNGKRPAKVGPEIISVHDYHSLIEMLVVCATQLDSASVPTLRGRMEQLHHDHAFVLAER